MKEEKSRDGWRGEERGRNGREENNKNYNQITITITTATATTWDRVYELPWQSQVSRDPTVRVLAVLEITESRHIFHDVQIPQPHCPIVMKMLVFHVE
jgi:hypothetical protein